jgi:hypothetical protein
MRRPKLIQAEPSGAASSSRMYTIMCVSFDQVGVGSRCLSGMIGSRTDFGSDAVRDP